MKWRNFFRRLFYKGPLLDYYRFTSPLPKRIVRLYEDSDYEACSDLYRLNEKGRFPEGYLSIYQSHLKKGNARILIIEDSGQVVGTGGISLTRVTDGFSLVSLSFGLIHPDFHGQGLGTLLFCARLSHLPAWRDWFVSMTSAGMGTEVFYKKLGFRFVSREEDEDGAMLEHYLVKILGKDVARLHKLISISGSAEKLDFNEELPVTDRRKEYQEIFQAQQDVDLNS